MLVSANILGPLISVFAAVIKVFHDNVGLSWGWSIMLLTVCVRLVLTPLMVKQYHSMRRMQHLQPQMKELQRRYKGNKQKQQEEMMKFYKENDINPMTSCLPMLAQAPVLYALFFMFEDTLRKDICPHIQTVYQAHYAQIHHVAVHAVLGKTTACGHIPGAGFLFIPDLTDKAAGITLVILILLYVGTQMFSMTFMQSPTVDAKQRRMMMFMPIVFVIFIIRFPAGLLVYWITSNAWTMVQGYGTMHFMKMPEPAVAVAGSGGSLPVEVDDRDKESSGGGFASLFGGEGASFGGMWRKLAGIEEDEEPRNGNRPRRRTNGGRVVPPPPPRKKKKRSGRRR